MKKSKSSFFFLRPRLQKTKSSATVGDALLVQRKTKHHLFFLFLNLCFVPSVASSMLSRLALVASRRSKETTEALTRGLAASSLSASSSASQSAVVVASAAAAASTSAPASASSASPAPIGGPVPVLKERGQAAVDARLKHEREMKGK